MIEDKVKIKQLEFEQMKSNFNQAAESPVLQRTTSRLFAAANTAFGADKEMEDFANVKAVLIQAIMGRK